MEDGWFGAVLGADEVAKTIVFATPSGTNECRLDADFGYDCGVRRRDPCHPTVDRSRLVVERLVLGQLVVGQLVREHHRSSRDDAAMSPGGLTGSYLAEPDRRRQPWVT